MILGVVGIKCFGALPVDSLAAKKAESKTNLMAML